MPVIYRRPDPADTTAAQIRLARLAQFDTRHVELPTPPAHEIVPAELIAEQPYDPVPARMNRGDSESSRATEGHPSRPVAALTQESEPRRTTGPVASEPSSVFEELPSRADPMYARPAQDRPAGSDVPPAEPLRPPDNLIPEPGSAWQSRWSRYLPTTLRGARLDPGRRGIAAVAAVAVLAAGCAAFGVWRSRPQPIEVAAPLVTAATAAPSASATPTVVVAVAGGVRRPGLFTLPVGSRVADAITAAGGVRPGVSIGFLNLARRLVDGEQVIVGPGAGAQPNLPAGSAAGPGTPLNLNTATLQQLDELPGVGPVLAQRILDYRTQHGAFRSVEQLREVGGIGEAKFADLRGLVAV